MACVWVVRCGRCEWAEQKQIMCVQWDSEDIDGHLTSYCSFRFFSFFSPSLIVEHQSEAEAESRTSQPFSFIDLVANGREWDCRSVERSGKKNPLRRFTYMTQQQQQFHFDLMGESAASTTTTWLYTMYNLQRLSIATYMVWARMVQIRFNGVFSTIAIAIAELLMMMIMMMVQNERERESPLAYADTRISNGNSSEAQINASALSRCTSRSKLSSLLDVILPGRRVCVVHNG